jgi:hypothetical protein
MGRYSEQLVGDLWISSELLQTGASASFSDHPYSEKTKKLPSILPKVM